jgi:hypothetical protein
MKALFLDFDGVLNSEAWYHARPEELPYPQKHFDPDAVDQVNRVIEATGACIVVSSSWRQGCRTDELRSLLQKMGVCGRVIGRTPYLGGQRGYEIEHWIYCADEEPESIVILDDSGDMANLMPWLVKTNFAWGLRAQEADQAIEMLGRPFGLDKVGRLSQEISATEVPE